MPDLWAVTLALGLQGWQNKQSSETGETQMFRAYPDQLTTYLVLKFIYFFLRQDLL